ncbi:uncharacterized protein N7477_000686 [Penicillium maclennaniae]|uniref:uncharacterized protein n=1 Tax=Penicillium maclennaniae TaxID=1343394 RepID=UPI002541907F|nr:uncharacterized protein N7477_000686 [Penicillium maclennaniae]KAJ5684341.1 hypothetical protein N7477_000686 [Penicillium maclennaniae]
MASTAFALDTLSPDGTRCIAGYSSDNAAYWSGPDGGLTNFHANTGWVTDPQGNMISEQNMRFNYWQDFTSSLPYTVDMYCGQDTSKTLTECTSVEVRYAGQDVMSKNDSDDCACGSSATVFEAKGYCACYFDC